MGKSGGVLGLGFWGPGFPPNKPLFSTAQELLQRAGDRGKSSSQEGEAVVLNQGPAVRQSQCCAR